MPTKAGNAARQKKRRDGFRAAGRCTGCGSYDLAPNSKRCQTCIDYDKRSKVRYRQKVKDETFAAYGGYTCACCGISYSHEFMCIDHINGGGNKHREELGVWGDTLHRWLKRNNYPPGFQVLCANCNQAKSRHKECPHQLNRQYALGLSAGLLFL